MVIERDDQQFHNTWLRCRGLRLRHGRKCNVTNKSSDEDDDRCAVLVILGVLSKINLVWSANLLQVERGCKNTVQENMQHRISHRRRYSHKQPQPSLVEIRALQFSLLPRRRPPRQDLLASKCSTRGGFTSSCHY